MTKACVLSCAKMCVQCKILTMIGSSKGAHTLVVTRQTGVRLRVYVFLVDEQRFQ